MTLYKWSATAASDATADSTINWQEGQAPSTVNDSGRAMMAATAKYRDDIAGAIVTGGTSTAYTVVSNQAFDTLAHLNGQMIAFTPHTTNGATVTLNVDSLGGKPLRTAPSVELQLNVLIQGTPYIVTYNNSDGAFYLHNLGSNTYGVPLLAGMDFWGAIAPSSAFVFPAGQAVSRTIYATAFAAIGTVYGSGDGSTTFNLPDKAGRVSAMKEATATRLTSAIGGVDGGTLGSAAGTQGQTLTITQIPSHTHSGTTGSMNSNASHSHPSANGAAYWGAASGGTNLTISDANSGPSGTKQSGTGSANTDHTHSFTTDNGTGGGQAHPNVQPTIICN